MTDVRVRTADTESEREDAFEVRRVVFVDEQAVDESLEWDDWDDDPATTHFVAYATVVEALDVEDVDDEGADADAIDREVPIGAARLRPKDRDEGTVGNENEATVGKVERVAVLESHRGTGVGRVLMDALEAEGRERGFDSFLLHSQTQAAGFYERLGYETFGEEFVEADIPHVKMRKDA